MSLLFPIHPRTRKNLEKHDYMAMLENAGGLCSIDALEPCVEKVISENRPKKPHFSKQPLNG